VHIPYPSQCPGPPVPPWPLRAEPPRTSPGVGLTEVSVMDLIECAHAPRDRWTRAQGQGRTEGVVLRNLGDIADGCFSQVSALSKRSTV
jgi:hypothetical protein